VNLLLSIFLIFLATIAIIMLLFFISPDKKNECIKQKIAYVIDIGDKC